ncbi:hypothetical protein TNCV_832031 [Trichonephila clavipes]|nr:hypothetical protein TNCV_832031 [Trichonephila clavipes]
MGSRSRHPHEKDSSNPKQNTPRHDERTLISPSCRLRETQRFCNRYLSSSQVPTRDRRTFTQPQEFLQGIAPIKHTGHDQEKGGNGNELKTLPPCTTLDCQYHKIPSTSVDEETNLEASLPENKINSKSNKKTLSIKRKNKGKESTEKFIFPQKTARPVSLTSTQDPIGTNNNFSDLEQDVEHPLSTEKQVTTEVVTPKKTLPTP